MNKAFNYHDVLQQFSQTEWTIMAVSLILFLAATPICRLLNDEQNTQSRISTMRVLNAIIILAILYKGLLSHESPFLSKTIYSLIVMYFAVFITQIIHYFIRRRFGKVTTTNATLVQYSDTYSSRSLSLISTAFVAIIAIITCLKILGLNSLTETGGALGIIGLVLAMTQAAWAPDIISGLIILNSNFCEDGDVIQFNANGRDTIASVFKRKLFHTECLDLASNHRIMIRNAKLRDYCLHNLSRFASARGLRECVLLNIDYKHSEQEVSTMIQKAFAAIDEAESSREEQYAPEVFVYDTADYAVTWAVYYYIKDIKQLLRIRKTFKSYILTESIRSNISLATPILIQNISDSAPHSE